MSLTKNLKDQLASTASGRPAKIQASEGKLHVVVALEDCDRLGCFLSRLDIEWVQGSMLDVDPRRIESRITYLGRSLRALRRRKKRKYDHEKHPSQDQRSKNLLFRDAS